MTTKKPTIEINGKMYEIKKVRPRDWREFFKFDSEKQDVITYEFLDKHCEVIAGFFDGLTADELLDNLEIGDVLKIYNDILTYLMVLLTSKLGKAEEKKRRGGRRSRINLDLTPYEHVLGYYLWWSRLLKMSFAEIDEMDLELLLDLAALQTKIDDSLDPKNKIYYIDEILG